MQDGSGAANSAGESPDTDADAPAAEKPSVPEPADVGTDKTLEGVVQVCTFQQDTLALRTTSQATASWKSSRAAQYLRLHGLSHCRLQRIRSSEISNITSTGLYEGTCVQVVAHELLSQKSSEALRKLADGCLQVQSPCRPNLLLSLSLSDHLLRFILSTEKRKACPMHAFQHSAEGKYAVIVAPFEFDICV